MESSLGDIKLERNEVKDLSMIERIGTHSHIRGLGLNDELNARDISEGMVGQRKARKAIGIILKMIEKGKIAGRAILLAGEPGSGKTAIAMGLAKSLGNNIPFVSISASELFSLNINKTEGLTQLFRKSILLNINETNEIINGEVVNINIKDNKSKGELTLKTTEMESTYDLGIKMINELNKLNINIGDIIIIDKNKGKINKLGKSYSKAQMYDTIGNEKFIECPSGELQKNKRV
mmetsp:Transcript_8689/g.10798  ORF Transcript_8689/g.10798 Transcript_8689/m.10798 type:complete len:235 (+) Transcript_8689:37-741(+)